MEEECGADLGEVDEGGATTITTELPVNNLAAQRENFVKVPGKNDDSVQIRKTIYSAAALRSTFWPPAFLTFSIQVIIIALYMDRPFEISPLEGDGWTEFSHALGRFISYFLIWTLAIADLQNAINLLLITPKTDKILGAFQLIVVVLYPSAYVSAIQSSSNFKEALTSTGILAMFLKLDETVTSVLDLGLMKREVGALVHSVKNPLPKGYRETVMNIVLMLYTCISFFYVWVVALDCYFVAIIFWAGFTLFFFQAFYDDMKNATKEYLHRGFTGRENDDNANDEETPYRRQAHDL